MTVFLYILLTTFLISLIAFLGALTLFFNRKLLDKILLYLVSFSAGALLGGAFLHLLPEAISEFGLSIKIFIFLLMGFCAFFILEQFINWHHHDKRHYQIKPFSFLILVSDGIHNFIDGLIIAASFSVDISLGLITVLVVALHEIPQEIGDFGILVYGGFKRLKALLLNFFSAVTIIIGGIVGYLFVEKISGSVAFLLSFAAGSFIYIASSDLIPEIKHRENHKRSLIHFSVFLFGIILMLVFKLLLDE